MYFYSFLQKGKIQHVYFIHKICIVIHYIVYLSANTIIMSSIPANKKICTAKNVQELLPEYSESTICRKINLCRDALNLQKHQILTLDKFMSYYGLL